MTVSQRALSPPAWREGLTFPPEVRGDNAGAAGRLDNNWDRFSTSVMAALNLWATTVAADSKWN